MAILMRLCAVLCLALGLAAALPARAHPTTACTLYAAPTGGSVPGTTPSTPASLGHAASLLHAGNILCLEGGTYETSGVQIQNVAGTARLPVVVEPYTPFTGPVIIDYNGTTPAGFIQILNSTYIRLTGFTVTANNLANPIQCFAGTGASSHIRFDHLTLYDAYSSGISPNDCDYTTIDHNQVFDTGYGYGNGSGISIRYGVYADTAPGFHDVVIDNIVTGSIDPVDHIDGNGIIVDQSGVGHANAPAVLIANNLVYENGGECVNTVDVGITWILNNTCYMNALDPLAKTCSIENYRSRAAVLANNIVWAWGASPPYCTIDANGNETSTDGTVFARDAWYGGGPSLIAASVLIDPTKLFTALPLFVNPPYVDPLAAGQYAGALDPALVGGGFRLQDANTLFGSALTANTLGVDPNTLTTDPTMQAQLRAYLAQDVVGQVRGFWNLGAYAG